MDSVLIDTNIFSYILKRHTFAERYRPHLDGKRLALSFMTLAELFQWAKEKSWGTKRIDDLKEKLSAYVILHSDDQTVWEYAGVRAVKGRPINAGDAWIAATALRHGLPLVTHNRSDFDHVPGLVVISEA